MARRNGVLARQQAPRSMRVPIHLVALCVLRVVCITCCAGCTYHTMYVCCAPTLNVHKHLPFVPFWPMC